METLWQAATGNFPGVEATGMMMNVRGLPGRIEGTPWYSKLEEALIQRTPKTAPIEQVRGAMRGAQVKQEELDWSGVEDYLAKHPQVNRDEFIQHIQKTRPQVGVDVRGEDQQLDSETTEAYRQARLSYRKFHDAMDKWMEDRANSALSREMDTAEAEYDQLRNRAADLEEARKRKEPKYRQYTEPGGENYREIILTVPKTASKGRPSYESPHFSDVNNPLVHLRVKDRVTQEGQQALFVEELQSDWHQAGRKSGYGKEYSGVPDAPFKKTWPVLGMKYALYDAAKNNKDLLAWTTGRQQGERYKLSNHITSLDSHYNGMLGNYTIKAVSNDGAPVFLGTLRRSELESAVGKEMANKIVEDSRTNPDLIYSGLDLDVGGQEMNTFYDRELVNEMNKYLKRYGAKVEQMEMPFSDSLGSAFNAAFPEKNNVQKVWAVRLTPNMKASILGEGQPLFQTAPVAATGLAGGALAEQLAGRKSDDTTDRERQYHLTRFGREQP